MNKASLFTFSLLLLLVWHAYGQNGNTNSESSKLINKKDSLEGLVVNYFEKKINRKLPFLLPIVSWNNYDKFHYGIAVFSNPFKKKGIKYQLLPSYSFNSKRINYSGNLAYEFDLFGENISFLPYVKTNSYNYKFFDNQQLSYVGVHPGLDIVIKNKVKPEIKHKFGIKANLLNVENLVWNNGIKKYEIKNKSYEVYDIKYESNFLNIADRNAQKVKIEFNSNMGKIGVSSEHKIDYLSNNNGFYFRFFGGSFLYKNLLDVENDYRFNLNGVNGDDDYTFSHHFIGRGEGEYNFLFRQIYNHDGFFKVVTPVGQTWDWLFALNLRTDLPGKIPFQVFFDIATYKDAGTLFPDNAKFPWNAGLVFCIVKDYVELYIPLFMSKDIENIFEMYNINIINRLTWMIKFDDIKPFKYFK